MNDALAQLLTVAPWFTTVLAAIGLATVACLFWAVVKPLFEYFTETPVRMVVTVGTVLLIVGAAFCGYAHDPERGAYLGGGTVTAVLGGVHVAWQFIRHCIKWNYNELGDGGI